eukprot:GHVO01037506.1.p2 GENE.GHVO01037506.1~~GHVO01037506.1.p2  ORF type:complete len:122 (+),score=1.03 GHVO01037506.1:301-666(+)
MLLSGAAPTAQHVILATLRLKQAQCFVPLASQGPLLAALVLIIAHSALLAASRMIQLPPNVLRVLRDPAAAPKAAMNVYPVLLVSIATKMLPRNVYPVPKDIINLITEAQLARNVIPELRV